MRLRPGFVLSRRDGRVSLFSLSMMICVRSSYMP